MPERDDHKKISSRRADFLDYVARALAVAERRFRRADQLDHVEFDDGYSQSPLRKGPDQCNTKRLPFGAADYPIFKTQSGSASVNSTPLSDPCPPGSLTFSENLSNEVISPKHLLETTMRARVE